ncbi:tetratricopeptide repeat protein [Parvibaculaceae bacterium PLY_AMNH_Bact1]|nr:tetratricopeptide repeat protein [Parvibaculaceae bacterium PLY_AMNH_Bact1]
MPRTYLRAIFLQSALILPMSVTAAYADFDRGLELYQSGDAAGAAEEWKLDAEEGNVIAAFLLGHMHKSGNGLTKSTRLAFPYFLQAAQRGHSDAQVETALYYYHGDQKAEIDQNYLEAANWFDKAALQFSGVAQYYLGVMHREGQGVARDRIEGLRWLSLSANKFYVPTYLLLAEIYAKGDGVVEEPVKAAMYLDLARRYSDTTNRDTVSEVFDATEHYINADQRAEGRLQAQLWINANDKR